MEHLRCYRETAHRQYHSKPKAQFAVGEVYGLRTPLHRSSQH